MRSSHQSRIFVRVLLILVPLLGSEVAGQLCPPGQLTHHDHKVTRCCLPVNCEPDYYVEFCYINGTSDRCKHCPGGFTLVKRTSSFGVDSCYPFPLSDFPQCKQLPGPLIAKEEDIKHCFCKVEDGNYYQKAENRVSPNSNCQPLNSECRAGEQPTQSGTCEPCPKNTVQDKDGDFILCRPQRNCTAMRLETETLGDSTRETVCAKPPPPPSNPPTLHTTTPARTTTQSSTATPSTTEDDKGIVGPSKSGTSEEKFPVLWVIVAFCCLVLVASFIIFVIIARRKGWLAGSGRCRHDGENPSSNGVQYPMSNRSDNDNTSDNSCCACADSCLASPSSSKGGGSGGASGKASAATWGETKNPKGLPLPMLEAYMNMNGKCGKESPGDGSLSEPLYNSISLDSNGKVSGGDMATYRNVNGVPPTLLRQEDFYNYPNKVRLSSSDDEDDGVCNTMNKDREIHRQQQQQRRVATGGRGEDFTETDPLLPNSENASSGVPTPVVSPGLRGILRNGPNRQDPRGGRAGGGWGGGEGGEVVLVAGNRPHLSMLLSSTEESSSPSSGDGCQGNNMPHLSQLMSNSPHSRSAPSTGPQPPIPPPPQPEAPEQHVHELPQQLQQHLLQQQKLLQQQLQQQQQQQQDGPGGPRLIPVSQPQLNPSLVQMEELKPVMPLNPSPTSPDNPPLTPGVPPSGAANMMESKGRSESPARISPSQQEEVRGKGSGVTWKPAQTSSTDTTGSPAIARKDTRVENDLNEQTFRKQAGPVSSPGDGEDDEETAHKSVGGSSGLGDSLDLSSLSDEGRKSRTPYRRSVSDVTRSVSPSQPLPPLRSISIPSPEEKHRPFAVVKPMQSDQSLNGSQDRVAELTQPLDNAGRHYPLNSLRSHAPRRQTSQDSDPELTRPKTPDRLSEDEDEENEGEDNGDQGTSDERTRANFYGNNDSDRADDNEGGASGKDKTSDGRSSKG